MPISAREMAFFMMLEMWSTLHRCRTPCTVFARQWAVARSVSTNLTDTVGVLNAIAGTTTTNRLDYNGVCNLIAGTFQLPAAQALRAVSS